MSFRVIGAVFLNRPRSFNSLSESHIVLVLLVIDGICGCNIPSKTHFEECDVYLTEPRSCANLFVQMLSQKSKLEYSEYYFLDALIKPTMY
jgi:hypothetical protein